MKKGVMPVHFTAMEGVENVITRKKYSDTLEGQLAFSFCVKAHSENY